jgi:penicillin-binding protein 1B
MDGIEMVTVNPQSGQRTETQCTGARQLPFMAGFAPTETDHCVMQEIRSILSGN